MVSDFIFGKFLKVSQMYKYLRYADDITLMAESDKELKNHLMRVKVDSEKAGLKLSIQKTKIIAITSWQIEMGKQWKQCQTLFF